MLEDWNYFLTSDDGSPAQMLVDLAVPQRGIDSRRPYLLTVEFPLRQPTLEGLSTSDESPLLYAIEDALFSALRQRQQAVYVGRVTGQSRRIHFYYAPSATGFDQQVAETMQAWPDYPPQSETKFEPGWDTYHQRLYPGPLERQSIQTRLQFEQMMQAGEDPSLPRPIEHRLSFPSSETRQQFISQAQPFGFEVEPSELGESSDPELPYGLAVVRSDRLDLILLDGLVSDLFFRADSCGGEYLGWAIRND